MNGSGYNQTCRLDGEKVASVMLSACCSHNPCNNIEKVHADSDGASAAAAEAVKEVMDGVESMKMTTMMTPKSSKKKKKKKNKRHSEGGRGGNLWREKTVANENGEGSSSVGGGDKFERSNSTPDFSTLGSIGPSDLLGMVLPCTGHQYQCGNSNRCARKSNAPQSDNNSRRRPFASNPLIDQTDSLVERQASLMSLLASDTMETVTTVTTATNTTATTAAASPAYTYATPPKNPKTYNHSNDSSGTTTPGMVRTPTRRAGGTRVYKVPAVGEGTSSTPQSDSPAMELSMAKQVANRTQMSNVRRNNRELLRDYRSPNTMRRGGGGGSSTGSSPNRAREKFLTPTKEGHRGEPIGTTATPATLVDNDNIGSNNSIEETRVAKSYSSFENAPLTPIWDGAKEGNVHSELASTYRYPRLYLQDPSRMILEHGDVTTNNDKRGNNNNGGLWWFHLAQRMETTLKHIQYNHWKEIVTEQLQQSQRNGGGNHVLGHSDSISAASSLAAHHAFGCAGLEVPDADSDGCVAVRDLCLGKHGQQQQQQQQQLIPYRTGSKSPQRRRSASKSPLPSYNNSNHKKMKKGASTGSSAAAAFRPSAPPVDVWSEPSASTLKVRGETYAKDGIKVESEPSIFSVVGVDSFVHGGCDAHEEDSSGSYLQRWNRVCKEIGLDSPPFLLIINFIVPWGNFQAYLIRPDADEGPFSSRHKHIPSEKAWREFMDGTTEHRNKRLKLIPRVCAGPWVVKRMVGSTPAIVGTKLPVSYSGSVRENYLKIDLDVTKGPAFGNTVANTVVGKADAVTVDLGFVIEGREEDGHLPERMLGLVRLHHLNMKRAPTHSEWRKELLQRCR